MNSYLYGFGVGIQRDEEHLHDALFADGKWDAQVAERVKGHRDLVALGTDERGLEEAVKRVYNHGVVPSAVVTPRLLRHFLESQTLQFLHLFKTFVYNLLDVYVLGTRLSDAEVM